VTGDPPRKIPPRFGRNATRCQGIQPLRPGVDSRFHPLELRFEPFHFSLKICCHFSIPSSNYANFFHEKMFFDQKSAVPSAKSQFRKKLFASPAFLKPPPGLMIDPGRVCRLPALDV